MIKYMPRNIIKVQKKRDVKKSAESPRLNMVEIQDKTKNKAIRQVSKY